MITKSCKCGAKSKEVQCARQFTCDVKCKRIRDCGKHPCNKKCCDGDCAPCEQMCGKTLNCKNHKCLSRCHQGPCYPCTQRTQVVCNCGETKITVPCGKEKNTKPPRCKKVCTMDTNCHHKERIKHLCHPGDCPLCKQICNRSLDCSHICTVPCHDNVQVHVEQKGRPAGPWEDTGPVYQTKKLPCPPCTAPVPIACLGNHEIANWPCHEAKPSSCGRKCGRQLPCTNHTCQRECHRVRHAPDDISSGINCKKCDSACGIDRPAGCSHPCNQGCHPGPCNPCPVNLKLKCHCGIGNLFIKCSEFCGCGEKDKHDLLCCKDQCPKLMECGHRCLNLCHSGVCSSQSLCKKRVKLSCPCKRRKEDFRCFTVNSAENPVQCDDECEEIKKKEMEKKNKSGKDRVQEDLHAKREAEIFEKQLEGGKRKRRNRRRGEAEEEEESFYEKNKIYVISFVVLVSIIVGYSATAYI